MPTISDEVKLIQCPCGGTPEITFIRDINYGHRVKCNKCEAISGYGTAFKNDKWNAKEWNTLVGTGASIQNALLTHIKALEESIRSEDAEIAYSSLNALPDHVRALLLPLDDECWHNFVSADNEVVTGAEICVNCKLIRTVEA